MFNKKKILRKLATPIVKRRVKIETARRARAAFYPSRKEMLDDIDNHPVSQELKMGERAPNITGTLDGKGNLFSFIGFRKGSDPVGDLKRVIEKAVSRGPTISQVKTNDGIHYKVKVRFPRIKNIEQDPSLSLSNYANSEVHTNRSWVSAIYRGFSGFGNYLYQKIQGKEFRGSRSGTAVQTPNRLRGGRHRPIPYLGPIFAKFRRNVIRRFNKK